MRGRISRLKSEMKKWEDGYQDWKVKWRNERKNLEIEKWSEEVKKGPWRLKSEIKKWEDEYQYWKLKWGNERMNIKIENWKEEIRGWT
jgi:hypothetical protein